MIRPRDFLQCSRLFVSASLTIAVLSSGALAAPESSARRDAADRKEAHSTPSEQNAPQRRSLSVSRTFSLSDVGFTSPLLFNGAEIERQIYFPMPDLLLKSAEINLAGTYVRSTVGHLTFLTSLDEAPIFAFEPTEAEGSFRRVITVPLNAGRLRNDFMTLGLKYSSLISENRCSDQRSIANVVAVSPESTLRYDVAAKDITDVRTAWRMLPPVTRILIPHHALSGDEYRAALRIALAVSDNRHTVRFVTLPDAGEIVDATGLAVPPALAKSPGFSKFNAAGRAVRIDTPIDRAAYGVLMSMQGHAAFGETAVGYGWLRDIVTQDLDALRKALGQDGAEKLAAFDNWIESGILDRDVNKTDNLKLATVYGQPLVVFDDQNASAAAGLIGSRWSPLAQTGSLNVGSANELQDTRTWIPLSDLSPNLAPISITEYGDWTANINASRLPPGRWPTSIELALRISPDASDVPPVLGVSMNDVLLRAERVAETGDIVRLTADIPSYLLSSTNTLRVSVQRGPGTGDCRSTSRGYPAQILPTSRVVLSDVKIDDQFFGLKASFAETGTVAIPKAYLENSADSLPFVKAFIAALGITPTSLRITLLDKPEDFSPTNAFVAFGVKMPGLRKDVLVDGGQLRLTSKEGGEAVQVSGVGNMAVAQITNKNNHVGVSINTVTGVPLRDVKVDTLAAGDLAVFSVKGQVLLLGDADYRVTSLQRALLEPAAVFHRYSVWFIASISIICMLIFMRLVRAFVDRRTRLKAAAEAETQA